MRQQITARGGKDDKRRKEEKGSPHNGGHLHIPLLFGDDSPEPELVQFLAGKPSVINIVEGSANFKLLNGGVPKFQIRGILGNRVFSVEEKLVRAVERGVDIVHFIEKIVVNFQITVSKQEIIVCLVGWVGGGIKFDLVNIILDSFDEGILYGFMQNPVTDREHCKIGEGNHQNQSGGKPERNFQAYG